MDLEGKYAMVWMSHRAFGSFLGQHPRPGVDAEWSVYGKIASEWPGGIWLTIEAYCPPMGKVVHLKEKPTYLLRWEWITTARLFLEKPRHIPLGGSQRELKADTEGGGW